MGVEALKNTGRETHEAPYGLGENRRNPNTKAETRESMGDITSGLIPTQHLRNGGIH